MKFLRVVGIVIAALLIVAISIPFFIDVNQFRPKLESELTDALGRPVRVGALKLSIFSGSLGASDLTIADDPAFSKSPFLQAKSLSAAVDLWPLIASRKVNVTAIDIEQPIIDLLQTPAGRWNYASLGGGAKTGSAPASSSSNLDLSVKLLKITGGRLTIAKTTGHSKPIVLDQVDIELRDFSRGSVMPFSLAAKLNGGGGVKLDGKAGPLRNEDLELTPLTAALHIEHLDLTGSGVLDPSTGIAGIASIDGSAESDGKRIEAQGRIHAEKLKLVKGGSPAARPVEFDFTVDHDLATHAGTLKRGGIHIGKAQASLTGTYVPHGDSYALSAHLDGPQMAVEELEAMLPALNVALPAGSSLKGGSALANLKIEGPLENLVSSGTLALNQVTLAGFDLGRKMSVIEALAGIPTNQNTQIETFSANVKNSDQGTSIDDLKLIAANIGELSGSGAITPARALDFKMRVALKNAMVPAAVGSRLASGVPFFVRGTAQDPKFEPDLKGMASQQINNLKGAATGLLDQLLNKKKN